MTTLRCSVTNWLFHIFKGQFMPVYRVWEGIIMLLRGVWVNKKDKKNCVIGSIKFIYATFPLIYLRFGRVGLQASVIEYACVSSP